MTIEAANGKGIHGESVHKVCFLKRIMFNIFHIVPLRINVILNEETSLFLISVINNDVEDIFVVMVNFWGLQSDNCMLMIIFSQNLLCTENRREMTLY